jgi:hypothetical protein
MPIKIPKIQPEVMVGSQKSKLVLHKFYYHLNLSYDIKSYLDFRNRFYSMREKIWSNEECSVIRLKLRSTRIFDSLSDQHNCLTICNDGRNLASIYYIIHNALNKRQLHNNHRFDKRILSFFKFWDQAIYF